MSSHLRIVGRYAADRLRRAGAEGEPTVVAHCHRRLRGPYTGVDTVLAGLLPDAMRRWPELVEQHRFELLFGIAELEDIIGPTPPTLATQSSFEERTRYFGSGLIRVMSQGIVSFLIGYAQHRAASGVEGVPLCLVFDDASNAEATTTELLAILVRRADPAVLRVIVAGDAEPLPEELETALAAHAERVEVDETPRPAESRDEAELLAAYIASDGTSENVAERAAYRSADPELVARSHDQRADVLDPGAGWGVRVGALAYHREHGSDPADAGRRALLVAYQRCVEVGFSAAIVDLGMRGRAVTDPTRHPRDHYLFTSHTASALVSLGRPEESLALYLDVRRHFTDPVIHMTTSYAIAMLHTRFLRPRDHDAALQWQNAAIAFASILPDPTDRLVYGVFQDNALALIEMHRGNLGRALDLVETGIEQLDAGLGHEQWLLHRSQLLYNRARLLAAMGRREEAYADFTTLIDLDPHYTDYLTERAGVSRKMGDIDAALVDYARAVRLAPPYPELYYNRGTARLAIGDIDGALADFAYVLDMEPGDIDTRLRRAEFFLDEGDLDAADRDVTICLRLRPEDPTLLSMKGTIRLERGDPAAALELLDAALRLDSRYPGALVNRAVAHFQLGDPALAVDDLTAALDVGGADPDVLLNRGLAYHAAGRTDRAVDDFDQALGLPGADLPELLFQRGVCLIESGESGRALDDLRECRRLGEHTEEIDELLASVGAASSGPVPSR